MLFHICLIYSLPATRKNLGIAFCSGFPRNFEICLGRFKELLLAIEIGHTKEHFAPILVATLRLNAPMKEGERGKIPAKDSAEWEREREEMVI